MKNKEGYNDPTAGTALSSVYEEGARLATVMHIIKLVCKLGGFQLLKRVEVKDVKSKTIYR